MMIRIYAFATLTLIFSTLCSMAEAKTELTTAIVFTNSTPNNLEVSISGSAQYQQPTTHIKPLSTATLAHITREDGNNSDLSIQLSCDNYQLTLTQQTQGTDLTFGASAEGLEIEPQDSPDIQRHNIVLAGAKNQLAFNGNDLDDGGQITYVLQKEDDKPALGGANQFNILSYNIWATSIYGSKSVDSRLSEMPEVMSGYDVLVLTEVFDDWPTNKLIQQLREEYPYQSNEIFKFGKFLDSGTRIISRWPFEIQDHLEYKACHGLQCAATRGVIHARINKHGRIYHIFATHTQSSDDEDNRNARLEQLQEMGDFIRSSSIVANEPVIMAGDFNVNKIKLPEDRDYLENALSAMEPENRGHHLSYDSDSNSWAEKPYKEYLDYTLYSNTHLEPVSSYQEVFAPRHTKDALWGKWDLSDHYAVRGIFTFPNNIGPPRTDFPFFGDVVHLKTHEGYFMRAMCGGDSFVSAGSSQVGTWESFTFEELDNGKVAIKANDGHYVGLSCYFLGILKANYHTPEAAAQFELTILDNNKLAIRADNNKFLRADFGGGLGLSAGSNYIYKNQLFEVIRP
ncbi:hypothetical protein ACH42_04000 [Endozoicomonas sp. (ex Bugula neritina AB1)]|nr:hypothetical protein ACH42_04000 [Endozoicomonas sp. (ex Bugula neritina AB1)]